MLFLNTFVTVICCLAVGLICYGWDIFNRNASSFIITSWGIIGAFFFFTLRDAGLRNALVLLLIFILIDEFLVSFPHKILYSIIGALFILALAASIYIYFRYFYSHKTRSLFNPLILAIVLTLISHIVQLVVSSLHPVSIRLAWHFWYDLLLLLVPIFLTGLGLGTGIWITDHPAVIKIFNSSVKIGK